MRDVSSKSSAIWRTFWTSMMASLQSECGGGERCLHNNDSELLACDEAGCCVLTGAETQLAILLDEDEDGLDDLLFLTDLSLPIIESRRLALPAFRIAPAIALLICWRLHALLMSAFLAGADPCRFRHLEAPRR